MKSFSSTLIFLVFIVLFFACSKPDENKNSDSEPEIQCIDSEFSEAYAYNFKPSCVIEDSKSNILILGKEENKITVIKLDAYRNVLWYKYMDDMYGNPMNIVEVNDGGYILTSGRMHFESAYGNPINSCSVQEGFELDSTNNYQPFFETRNDYTPEYQTSLDNIIYVSKIDEDGNILNQTSDAGNYTPGQIIQSIENNEFLMTIFRFRGDGAYYNYPWGPPISFPKDKNLLIFYKLDLNGTFVFSNGLYDALVYESIDEILNNKIEFSIAVNGDQYVVNLPNETYLTDHYGFEENKYQPKFNFTGNHTFSMTYADSISNYFIGRADFFNGDIKYYLLKAKLDGDIIWYKDFDAIDDAKLRTTKEGFMALTSIEENHRLIKYNSTGIEEWQIGLNKKPDFYTPTCNGGVILIRRNETYNLLEVEKIKISD